MPEAGLFTSLNTAVLGMYTQQMAISVVSHNIANANTPGFSRQRPVIVTTPPLSAQTLTQPNMPIAFGTGSKIKDVERIRDSFLDLQYRQANSKLGFWNDVNTQFQYIQQLMSIPGGNGLRAYYDNFWKAAQQVATTPANVGAKSEFVQSAKALVEKAKSIYASLEDMRKDYTHQIESEANNLNSILKGISNLNVKIRESSVLGSHPNDLLDKRDLLLDKLSKETKFSATTSKDGEISLTIGGNSVLSGQRYVPIKFQRVDGKPNEAFLSANNMPLNFKSGKIGSLFHLRDEVVRKYEDALNGLILNLSDKVNTILKQSYDQNGNVGQPLFLFSTVLGQPTALFKIASSNPPDGYVYDPSKKISDLFSGVTGEIDLNINGANIRLNASDDSLNSLISKVNSARIGVEMSLSPRGNLVIRATKSSNYDLLRYNDQDGKDNPIKISAISNAGKAFLLAVGFKMDGNSLDLKHYLSDSQNSLVVPFKDPAMHVEVNSALISDPTRIATDFDPTFLSGSSIGVVAPSGAQNSNGMQMIVNLKSVDKNGTQSMDAFFGTLVSNMGVEGQSASAMYENTNSLVNQIELDRKQVSSVSINDEMSQMLLYQNAYTASARVVSTVNSMIQTLVDMVR